MPRAHGSVRRPLTRWFPSPPTPLPRAQVIKDHISLPCLSGAHPLVGHNDARFGARFPAVNGVYSAPLQAVAASAAEGLGLGRFMRAGTYFHDSGPSYESPMEIHAMRVLGGDAGAWREAGWMAGEGARTAHDRQ